MTEKDIENAFQKQLEQLTNTEGFCSKKTKFKIESVNDFVTKLQEKMAVYCRQFLAQDNPDWGGIKKLFFDFYGHVKEALNRDTLLFDAVDETIEEISEYVMF